MVLERKTLTGAWNYTTKVSGYFNTEPNSIDVVGFGSSHMYCSVNPTVMEPYNVNAYVLATQQQPVKASYYYMLEALKTQQPKAFIFEAYMVNNSSDDISDAIIADATDPLPLSGNKLKMIHSLTKNKKSQLSYYLTLFRYSGRWKEVTNLDFHLERERCTTSTKAMCTSRK